MNKLLKKQRLFASYALLIKSLLIVALSLFYIFIPEFQFYFHISIVLLALFSIFCPCSSVPVQKKTSKPASLL